MQDERAAEQKQVEDSKINPQAFEPIYKRHYEPVLRFVYKRIENLEDCREVTSLVFTKALVNVGKYKDRGYPFSSWLYRIALNEIAQFYRNSKKLRIISIDERSMANVAEEAGGIDEEMVVALKKSLLRLTEEELLLIEMRYFEERSFSEIGSILEITEGNAKTRTYRVIEKLKGIYSKVS